jgi:hypothetical protein
VSLSSLVQELTVLLGGLRPRKSQSSVLFLVTASISPSTWAGWELHVDRMGVACPRPAFALPPLPEQAGPTNDVHIHE